MTSFIQNILWNSIEGFVEAGTRSAGELAGNALIKAGDVIENSGRGIGNSIEKKATNYASSIAGPGQPSPKPLPTTAHKPIPKHSNSLPASSKLVLANGPKPTTNSPPLGSKKHARPAKKTTTGDARRAHNNAAARAPGRAITATGSTVSGVKALHGAPSSSGKSSVALNGFPSGASKIAAVKPGTPKPFVGPREPVKVPESKPKPLSLGPSTLPGRTTTTPAGAGAGAGAGAAGRKVGSVRRLDPQVRVGKEMQHIPV